MNPKTNASAPVTIVWEFRVPSSQRREFETAYGSDGDWARLFRNGKGYIRTELHRDQREPDRYFTLDFWRSRADYYSFKQQNAAEYKLLDQRCSTLTREEKFFDEYETPEQVNVFLVTHGFPSTNVRAASAADIRALLALERSASTAAHWEESAYAAIFDRAAAERIALVLEDKDQQVRGFAIARISGNDWELENIAVQESNRRRGSGRILLNSLIAAASLRRAERIFLEVRESNVAARRLYEKLGFKCDGERPCYYSDPIENAVLYSLGL